jgi:hypothetical protein
MAQTHSSSITTRIDSLPWADLQQSLHHQGFVSIPNVLSQAQCAQLIDAYDADETYRKTINMERYRFGSGEYKYYRYPLPELITELRESVYPHLAPVANQWAEELNLPTRYPATQLEMLNLSHTHGQTKPTVLILKYGPGGFNTLHQDLYGEVFFPMQMVFMLGQVDTDYTGGQFVLTEQIPRAQSKANVLTPGKGDMLLFTTNFRPVKGTRGYYRVNMKHGVSPVHTGHRHTLGIIFHDALT